jgi:hypothetical protein
MSGMEALSDVLATADVLYGLLPEDFTAVRDDHVRTLRRSGSAARARAVKELRRPSVAAWLVNALVRHRQAEVEQLLQVGLALREAQDDLDAGQLRELNRQRQAVLTAITKQARALAGELGRPVSDPVLAEVEETLRAALADVAAANAVRSGRLTTALRYAGFGDADELPAPSAVVRRRSVVAPRSSRIGAAPAGTPLDGTPSDVSPSDVRSAAASQAAIREARMALAAAEDAAQRTEGAALVAEQQRESLLRRARVAQDRLEAAHAQVAELESLLAAARAATSTAAAAWAPLHAEAEAAAIRADTTRGIADSARAVLWSTRAHLAEVERTEPVDPEVSAGP